MNSTTSEAHPNTGNSDGSNEEDVNINNNNDTDDANSQEDNNITKPTEEQLIERSVQVRKLLRRCPSYPIPYQWAAILFPFLLLDRLIIILSFIYFSANSWCRRDSYRSWCWLYWANSTWVWNSWNILLSWFKFANMISFFSFFIKR